MGIFDNKVHTEIGDYVHKRNAPDEEEQKIRRAWYRAGVHAFGVGHLLDSCVGSTVCGTHLTPERKKYFEAGWRYAYVQVKRAGERAAFVFKSGAASPFIPTATEIYARELLKEFYQPYQKENKTMKINVKDRTDTIEIGKLAYGTYVTGITGHPDTVYQKVDKRKTGQGITLDFPKNHSLIMNVKLGSLRVVPGDTLVSVYEAELNLSRTTNFGPHLKDNIF